MASLPIDVTKAQDSGVRLSDLRESRFAIGGPRFDFLLFWGVPVLALVCVQTWLGVALAMPPVTGERMAGALGVFSAILTYAHLIAVAPRAYLNRDVFEANRTRLTLVPCVLLAGLLISPVLLVIGAVVAIFWDVHHSAMQNFGLSRIYDMKAGNDAQVLRPTDLRLNWMLYVGPLLAGASLPVHLAALRKFESVGFSDVARLPGLLEGHLGVIGIAAIIAWAAIIGWTIVDYRKAIAAGYRLPIHKLALVGSTGLVSVLAWGLSSPLVALIAINIYHALQYFALVWLKEGGRMTALTKGGPRIAMTLFLCGCGIVGLAYQFAATADIPFLIAPFLACSLLHFWYDSFVWSVRKKQV